MSPEFVRSVVLPSGTVIEYLHNANNQRVAKKVDGVITEKYLWKDLTTLLAVYDGNDNLKIRFEYADGRMPYKMTYEGTTYYLAYDQVGTLKAVSGTNGNVVKAMTYDTFGNLLSESNPTMTVPFGFAGGLYDRDTGLTRFGYRDYDAATGKWTAKDPIGFNGGDTNLYGYVLNDPVNLIDPSGLVDQNDIPTNSLLNSYLHQAINTYEHPNAYTVATHGDSGWITSDVNEIVENAIASGKSEILLIACDQGDGPFGNAAQYIANHSNLPVQYSTGPVHTLPFVGPMTFYPDIWQYAYPK